MNSEQSISGEDLRALLAINTQKMNFQQSICINIRNWAFGITGIFVPLIWTAKFQSLPINITLHLITIALISLILYRDLCWHAYFFLFCERARIIENVILKQKDQTSLIKKYYEFIEPEAENLKPDFEKLPKTLIIDAMKLTNLITFNKDYVEIYLILLLIISMIVKIVTIA